MIGLKAFLLGFLLLLAIPCAASEVLLITPSRELTQADQVRRASAQATAATTVEGRGGVLRILYSATAPIDLDFAPLHGNSVDPTEQLHTSLPTGERMEARIDLTQGTGWSMFSQMIYMQFLTQQKSDRIDVLELTVEPIPFSQLLRAAWNGLLRREQFSVSTPHALRGQRLAGIPLTLILGCVTLLIAMFFLLRKKNPLLILMLGSLIYSLWFGWDLLRFTGANASEWFNRGTLADVGSAEEIGAFLRETSSSKSSFLFVCTDTGNYYTKAVRYFVFPVPVSRETADIPQATHVLVVQKFRWSFEAGMLDCGSLNGKATRVREFSDGSILFTAIP